MFKTVLLIITKYWKQLKLISWWMTDKMRSSHTKGSCSKGGGASYCHVPHREAQKHAAKWEETITRDRTLCDSVSMKYPEKDTAGNRKQTGVVWGQLGTEGDCPWTWRSGQGVKEDVLNCFVVMAAPLCVVTKNHWIDHLRSMFYDM